MSGVHHAQLHPTSSPPHMRKVVAKLVRTAPSLRPALTPRITIKAARTTKRAKDEDEEVFEDYEDDMGSSFLQYCTMCDKQIVVPNSSILYCSESCRYRDATMSTLNPYPKAALESLSSPPSCSEQTAPFDSQIPRYVPALKPTPRTDPDGRIPAKLHDGKSDLDPTEWKPAEAAVSDGKSPTGFGEWKPKLTHRSSSEAASFLGKFHKSSDSLTSRRRPVIGHGRSTVSSRSTPGLSHTSTASNSSEESLSGTPYEFVARPVLSVPITSTKKPSFSITYDGTREADDLTYEKKHVGASLGSARGSLKKLLGSTGGV